MIKKDAQQVQRELREMGYKVHFLTGGGRKKSYAVLIVGYGSVYSLEQFEKFKQNVQKASEQEQEQKNGGK